MSINQSMKTRVLITDVDRIEAEPVHVKQRVRDPAHTPDHGFAACRFMVNDV